MGPLTTNDVSKDVARAKFRSTIAKPPGPPPPPGGGGGGGGGVWGGVWIK